MDAIQFSDIPVVLLAGGRGTRLMEETRTVPKPMVSIGDRPILFHIMRYYAVYGFRRFVICIGYKGHIIKDYFIDFNRMKSDLIIRANTGKPAVEQINHDEFSNWEVILAETGENSLTARRIHRVRRYIDTEVFALTYGDGLADIDLSAEFALHNAHGKKATVAAVHPPSRFGRLQIAENGEVVSFQEKEFLRNDYINGGFFFFRRSFLDRLDGANVALEAEPLRSLAEDGELAAYRHEGFWQCMDTLRDRNYLQMLYEKDQAPWKIW